MFQNFVIPNVLWIWLMILIRRRKINAFIALGIQWSKLVEILCFLQKQQRTKSGVRTLNSCSHSVLHDFKIQSKMITEPLMFFIRLSNLNFCKSLRKMQSYSIIFFVQKLVPIIWFSFSFILYDYLKDVCNIRLGKMWLKERFKQQH